MAKYLIARTNPKRDGDRDRRDRLGLILRDDYEECGIIVASDLRSANRIAIEKFGSRAFATFRSKH